MNPSAEQQQTAAAPAYPVVPGPEAATSVELAALLAALRQRFGASLQGVILYGSCLRSGDLLDGLVDLYVLVDDYRHAYTRRRLRLGNALLPPNVFYLEVPVAAARVRCKYAVLSLADFERGTRRWFESYLWGRFAQPVKPVFAASLAVAARIDAALLQAVETFLRRILPLLPAQGRLEELWQQALAQSYATELRAERAGRAAELSLHGRDFLLAVSTGLAPRLRDCLDLTQEAGSGEWYYSARVSGVARRLAPWAWRLRRVQGKLLSLLRLLKALFTFEGGLDYIAWKLERHSGQVVEIPDKVRRRPLLHIWGLCWRLYRRGVFR